MDEHQFRELMYGLAGLPLRTISLIPLASSYTALLLTRSISLGGRWSFGTMKPNPRSVNYGDARKP